MDNSLDKINAAYTITLINLRNNYHEDGIYAGRSHFSDIWARDSLFASLGALAVGDYSIVKRNLQSLIKHMANDGQIPLRVGQKSFVLKYLGFKREKQARYVEDKEVSTPMDSNSLFIIVFKKYLELTNDLQFARNHMEQLKKIIDWNFTQDKDKDFLIEEGSYAGWADSLNKKGKVLYTNTLHYKAVESYIYICETLQEKELTNTYRYLANQIKDQINCLFWEEDYYVDQVQQNKKRHLFSTDGNLFAILFNIASKQRAEQIIKSIKTFELDQSFCVGTNYPKYSFFEIYPPFLLIQMKDYHNGLTWLWLGCIHAVVIYKLGMQEEAMAILLKISEKIIEYKGVYEVYNNGKPVKRLFYQSELGFTWSAGLFVWACKQLGVKS